MPFKKTHELVVKTGTYQKEGSTKNRYKNIGSLMEDEDGKKFILLDPTFNIAGIKRDDGKDMVLVSLFSPKTEEVKQEATKPVESPDDISWQN